MYEEKIQRLEAEIAELKECIKNNRKEIKKRANILVLTIDEEVETEVEMYNEEIEKFKDQIRYKKQLLRNYKRL